MSEKIRDARLLSVAADHDALVLSEYIELREKEHKPKTRTLREYYKHASIPVKKSMWKRRKFIKPICSSVTWKSGWYDIHLTFEEYGEHYYKAVDCENWFEIADDADKFFSKLLRRLI